MNKDKYPRTHLGTLLTLTALLVCASLPASAQSRTSGQAVLHIQVYIVPALISPPPPVEPKIPLGGTVAYNVSTVKPDVEVIEETRPLLIRNANGAEGLKGAVLKTRTIVPH